MRDEHAGVRASGANRAEIVLGYRDSLFHLLFGIEECFIDHDCSSMLFVHRFFGSSTHDLTRVPIFSPATARAMFPSVRRLNTSIGIWLSMHRLNAVASATLSPARSPRGA